MFSLGSDGLISRWWRSSSFISFYCWCIAQSYWLQHCTWLHFNLYFCLTQHCTRLLYCNINCFIFSTSLWLQHCTKLYFLLNVCNCIKLVYWADTLLALHASWSDRTWSFVPALHMAGAYQWYYTHKINYP